MQHSQGQKESTTVTRPAVRQAQATVPYVRIEVSDEDGGKLWQVITDNDWAGEYLGNNTFVFTQEQLAKIQEAGVRFRTLD